MERFGMRRRIVRFVALGVSVAAAVGVDAVARSVPVPPRLDDEVYATWIESRAGGVFDPATPQIRSLSVAYRIDAHILLPLGFTALNIWSRKDVGLAAASYRDCRAEADDVLRGYEFFSTSRPERAQGFDRLGFFREAVRLTPAGPAWTAYFGAMTSVPEENLDEARKTAAKPPATYEAIDGFSAPFETRSSVFRVATDNRARTSTAIYAAVRPQLSTRPPRYKQFTAGTEAKPLPPLAFFGALQISLRRAAVNRARPLVPAATRIPFTHNGTVRQLELSAIASDSGRARAFSSTGLVHQARDVYRLEYRILNPGSEDGAFKLWAELPSGMRDDPQAPPIAPLAWEMLARSFLRLHFERTR